MKRCATCGGPLGPGYPNRKHCSALCRDRFPPRKCDECGKKFRPVKKKNNKSHSGRFCSTTCAGRWAAKRPELLPLVNRKCLHCGKLMKETHHNKRYCSAQCRLRPLVMPCLYCGKAFTSILDHANRARSRFCSRECVWKGMPLPRRRTGWIPTEEEMLVWKLFPQSIWNYFLRTGIKKMDGRGNWLKVDIAFPEIKLAVEIDGGVHRIPKAMERDRHRTKILESLGWTVLRFWNKEVTQDLTRVKEAIESTIFRLQNIQVTP